MTLCTGTTQSGQRCGHHATPGFPTCAAHRRQHQHAQTILAGDLAPDGAITCHQEDPPRGLILTTPPRSSRQNHAAVRARQAAEADARKAAPPIGQDDARTLLTRMLRDGLITQTRDGQYHLRSYGRDVLTALQTITQEGTP